MYHTGVAVVMLKRRSQYESLYWECKEKGWVLYPTNGDGVYPIHGIDIERVGQEVVELRTQPYILAAEVENNLHEGHAALLAQHPKSPKKRKKKKKH